jgi:ABC-type uncharacterized transport system YnjBCD substrate-binding protein
MYTLRVVSLTFLCVGLLALSPTLRAEADACDQATFKLVVNPLYDAYKDAIKSSGARKSRKALLSAAKTLSVLRACRLSADYESIRQAIISRSGSLEDIERDLLIEPGHVGGMTAVVVSPTSSGSSDASSLLSTNPMHQLSRIEGGKAVGAVIVSSDDLNLFAERLSKATDEAGRNRVKQEFGKRTQTVTLEKIRSPNR